MTYRTAGLMVLALSLSCFAVAQGPRATATLRLDKSMVAAGATVTGHVSVTFPDGYHGYQNPPSEEFEIPVKVSLPKGSVFKIVKINYPKGAPMTVPGETKPSAVYSNTIDISVILKAPAKVGTASLALSLDYQECNASSCLPPDSLPLSTSVKVTAAAKKGSKTKKS